MMNTLEFEFIPPCKICHKIWQRKDGDNWYFHESIGVVCRHHYGVKEWYAEMLQEADRLLNERG